MKHTALENKYYIQGPVSCSYKSGENTSQNGNNDLTVSHNDK